jgi:hypothetical protein
MSLEDIANLAMEEALRKRQVVMKELFERSVINTGNSYR